jgi:hypothetical protein
MKGDTSKMSIIASRRDMMGNLDISVTDDLLSDSSLFVLDSPSSHSSVKRLFDSEVASGNLKMYYAYISAAIFNQKRFKNIAIELDRAITTEIEAKKLDE